MFGIVPTENYGDLGGYVQLQIGRSSKFTAEIKPSGSILLKCSILSALLHTLNFFCIDLWNVPCSAVWVLYC